MPLDRAIDKAKKVAAEIQQAADNLSIVNAVLQERIPREVQVGDVAQALDQSDEVEEIIDDSAKALEQVNGELEQAAKSNAQPRRG